MTNIASLEKGTMEFLTAKSSKLKPDLKWPMKVFGDFPLSTLLLVAQEKC